MAGEPDASILAIFAAPFVGSFLGVIIRRLPVDRPIALDRSRCEACGRALGLLDLVPIVSFVALRGRCRHCGAPIAVAHLGVELAASAVAVVATVASDGDGLRVWAGCLLGWVLLALGWIDRVHGRLPDILTLPLVLMGLAVTDGLDPGALTGHAAAAAAGYLLFRGVAFGYRRLRGREGLGQGDAKLLAAAGAWVGLAALPHVILAAALMGIAFAVAGRLRGARLAADTELAFGPSLALAIWVVWLTEGTL